MNKNALPDHSQTVIEKRQNGLKYGLLAGLVFALAGLGLDAYLLASAQAALPWLKFALALPACLLIGGAAGWLAARLDNSLLGGLIWLAAGILLGSIVSHIPFEGVSTVYSLLQPELRGLPPYPYVPSAVARSSLLAILSGILFFLGGALELYTIDNARGALSPVGFWFTLLLTMPLFAIAGSVTDNLINEPLRTPLLAVDQLIKDGLRAETTQLSLEEIRDLHLRIIDPFKSMLHEPRRLFLGSYDPQAMDDATVILDFNGVLGLCAVNGNNPLYCQRSSDYFPRRLACAISAEPDESCSLKIDPEAASSLEAVRQGIGSQPQVAIDTHRGQLMLMAVRDESGAQGGAQGEAQFLCKLRLLGDITLLGCDPAPALQFPMANLATTPVPAQASATRTPGAVQAASQPTEKATAAASASPTSPTADPLAGAPRYTLTLNLDWEGLIYTGSERLEYANNESQPMDSLFFRLLPNGRNSYGNGRLTVTATRVNGQAVQGSLSRQDTVLEVPLGQALPPGSKAEIELEFNGKVPRDFGGNETPAGYGIFNLSDEIMVLSAWYPMLAVYDQAGWHLDPVSPLGDAVFADIGSFTVELSAPANLVVAATGSEEETQADGETTRRRYESGPAREFTLALSPRFQVSSEEVDGVKVNSYFLPGSEEGGNVADDVAAASIGIFNDKFGAYPYPEFDVIQAPMRNASAVEFPGLTLIKQELYQKPDDAAFLITVAHEVGHQWWYNVVGNDVFAEPWLDEALATYTSSLYYEFHYSKQAAQGYYDYLQQRYDLLVDSGKDDLVTQSLKHFEEKNEPVLYSRVVYTKGALFFKALREKIGDKAFFGGLQAYYRDYHFRIATTEDLLNEFEQAAGQQLDDFYQEWLYSAR